MVLQLLDLKPRVAPVFSENIFLLAVKALRANRELFEFLREFLGVLMVALRKDLGFCAVNS